MKVKFVMAEEIRPEVGGKMTILGLFPADEILLTRVAVPEGVPSDTPMGIDKITFLLTISKLPSKKYKFTGSIIDPSGEPYKADMQLGEARFSKGISHSIIVESRPFIVKTLGVYHFNLYVGKELVSFPFEIRMQPIDALPK